MQSCSICNRHIDPESIYSFFAGKSYHSECVSDLTKCPKCGAKSFVPRKKKTANGDICIKCNYSYRKFSCDKCGVEHHTGTLKYGVFTCDTCIEKMVADGKICKICHGDTKEEHVGYEQKRYVCMRCGIHYCLEDNSQPM